MNTNNQSESPASERTRLRCRMLGMPTLRCATTGQLVDPDPVDALDNATLLQVFDSPFIKKRLVELAARWETMDLPEPMSLCEPLMAIPIPYTLRRRRSGYLVVVTQDHACATESAIAALAAQCDAPPADLLEGILTMAVSTPESIRSLAALLNWSQDDVIEMTTKDRAIETFSAQLAENYEEISLLYRMSHLMTELAAPERFVEQTCEELHNTLSFAWVGAAFVSDHQLARDMAGVRVIHNAAPNRQDYSREALEYTLDAAGQGGIQVVSAERFTQATGFQTEGDLAIGRVVRAERLVGVIVAGGKEGLDTGTTSADLKLIDAAASSMGIFLENACLYDDQQVMFLGVLEALSAAIDAKDRYTCGHSERVAHLAVKLAEQIELDEELTERLRISGLVHDIGKIGVPESVLTKPGRLTLDEFEIIKRHPEIGVRILRDIPQLTDVLPGVLHHHERWDGRGYPYGLAGDKIPLFARLLALADSFDAMSSTRTYRAAMPRPTVLGEIRKGAGAQFDPAFATMFIQLDFTSYDRMVETHMRQDPQQEREQGAAA